MPVFHYVASTHDGIEQRGTLESESAKAARQQLREQGLLPLSIESMAETHKTAGGLFKRPIRASALANLTREFASLVSAGMPVDEALSATAEQLESSKLKTIILGVRAKLLEGFSLARSLGEYPHVFPDVYRQSVAAGEASGHLAHVLEQLADYSERSQHVRQKIQQAMIYPLLMTITSIAVIIFLLAMVVPKMIAVFEDQGQSLPLPTEILLSLSHGLQHYGIYLAIILIAAVVSFRVCLRRSAFKTRWHRLLLRLPLIKRTLKTVNTARYAQTLGLLVSAGIPIIEAMRISQSMVTAIPIANALRQATTSVQEGMPIHRALKQTGYFAPVMIHFIANGEKSGQLEQMLLRAAQQQDRQVSLLIDTGLTVFEPVLILVMGAVVLFIVLAILLPMFEMTQLVG